MTPQQQWWEKPISELIQALKSKKKVIRDAAAYQLSTRGNCECLTHLRELQSEIKNSWEYCSTVSKIQAKCQFYNYTIAQWELAPHMTQRSPNDLLAKIDKTTQDIKKMANQPKNDFSGATFQAPVNFGDNPTGNFIGTQNNHATDPEVKRAIANLQTLITQLQTRYPNATDEQLSEILLNGFEEMPQQNPKNWQRWQDIFSILFAGGVEAAKILVPVSGIPIEVLKRLYEIYQRHPKQLPGN